MAGQTESNPRLGAATVEQLLSEAALRKVASEVDVAEASARYIAAAVEDHSEALLEEHHAQPVLSQEDWRVELEHEEVERRYGGVAA
jgi:hypothetical protein